MARGKVGQDLRTRSATPYRAVGESRLVQGRVNQNVARTVRITKLIGKRYKPKREQTLRVEERMIMRVRL